MQQVGRSLVSTREALFRKASLRCASGLTVLWLLTWLSAPALLPRLYFIRQDGIVIAGLVGLLIAFSFPRVAGTIPRPPSLRLTTNNVVIGAMLLAMVLWAGTYLLFRNYPMSRDEQMVVFDTEIFRQVRLAAPLAPEWRHYAEALTPAFLLPLPGNAAWVSSYMPGNAMLRTLFGALLDPALMNPILAAAGGVATFDCARRLFPDSRGAQAIALLMYATSAQVLVMAMTPFAMAAHLALNMIWLSFYLRATPPAHAGAIAIGFVAIGLHQIIFHPLFALPFLDHLRRQGRWRTAVIYAAFYVLFGLFWISYPHLVAVWAGLRGQTGATVGIGGFIAERIIPLFATREPQVVGLMEANLLRFIAWENLALVPLMILGWGAVRRSEGIARPLAAGIALTFGAMAFLLPYQAIGWGYRYLHGLIGNCALLAGYGWNDYSDRAELRAFVRAGSIATVLATIPFLTWQTSTFIQPYARVDRMIEHIDADMVVIQTEGPAFRIDEVRNRPDLKNRPLRLAGHLLKPTDIAVLCTRGSIAFVDSGQMQTLGVGFGDVPSPKHFQSLREAARKHCVSKR